MSFNPYRNHNFVMPCFSVDKTRLKRRIVDYQRQLKIEDESNSLKRELESMRKTHISEFEKQKNQLRQALEIIQANRNIIDNLNSKNNMQIKNNNNSRFNEESSSVNESSGRDIHNRGNEREDDVEREFNKRARSKNEKQFSTIKKYKGDRGEDDDLSSSFNHQKNGKTISFAQPTVEADRRKVIKNTKKYEEEEEEEEYDNEDDIDGEESSDEVDGNNDFDSEYEKEDDSDENESDTSGEEEEEEEEEEKRS